MKQSRDEELFQGSVQTKLITGFQLPISKTLFVVTPYNIYFPFSTVFDTPNKKPLGGSTSISANTLP